MTNTSNLDAFTAMLPGGGGGRIYTGRCVQEPLTSGMLDASRRQEVRCYVALVRGRVRVRVGVRVRLRLRLRLRVIGL